MLLPDPISNNRVVHFTFRAFTSNWFDRAECRAHEGLPSAKSLGWANCNNNCTTFLFALLKWKLCLDFRPLFLRFGPLKKVPRPTSISFRRAFFLFLFLLFTKPKVFRSNNFFFPQCRIKVRTKRKTTWSAFV